MKTEEQAAYEPLTDREREILHLIAEGLTNQQIADRLFLTLDTVKWYNKQTFQKLRVRNRIQAVARARELSWLGQPVSAPRHNLPPQGALFVGREQELAELEARLGQPACRLLTLLGSGGIGKTRLAIEAARRQLPHYADGVYFVPFAQVESPAFVVQALADGLGVVLTDQRDALQQVTNYLRQKSVLLVLDNFEHLVDGVTLLGQVLARSQAAKLLVTSRQRLGLKEEWLFDVQGLHYPTAEPGKETETDLAAYEAGQLFLWTAQRANADFRPDAHDQSQIARICQLVGGMPLGIELAASWVRVLSCGEIAGAIAQDLDLLTTPWRDVPERHRSIQAVLDHSWKLLSSAEQDALRKLTVFSGSFQRAAATAVAAASLSMLLALVDKSFLQQIGQDRFGFHELIKQYCRAKLQTDPTTLHATQLCHCRYHAQFLLERMHRLEDESSLAEVESVFDDLQSAWRYAVENQQRAEIQRLATGFLTYYRQHSWYRAGAGARTLYQQALACFESGTPAPAHQYTIACLYESLGHLYELASAREATLEAYEQALHHMPEDEYVRRGRLYGKIADVWVAMNQHEEGHEFYTRAETVLDNARARDDAWWREWLRIQIQRMELYYWQNRPDAMQALADQMQPMLERHGVSTQRVRYLYMLAMMAARRDRYYRSHAAVEYSGQALALSLETGNLGEIAYRHFTHGFAHLWLDQLDIAETHLQMAREMTEQNGDLSLLARAVTYLTVIYRKRGDTERVRELVADSLRIAEDAEMPQYIGMAYAQAAWLAWRARDPNETKRLAHTAIDHWGGLGQAQSVVPFRWYALFPLLDVALQAEDLRLAVRYAELMLIPPQQRLPDDLSHLLQRAVHANESDNWPGVIELLHQALLLARQLHYL